MSRVKTHDAIHDILDDCNITNVKRQIRNLIKINLALYYWRCKLTFLHLLIRELLASCD